MSWVGVHGLQVFRGILTHLANSGVQMWKYMGGYVYVYMGLLGLWASVWREVNSPCECFIVLFAGLCAPVSWGAVRCARQSRRHTHNKPYEHCTSQPRTLSQPSQPHIAPHIPNNTGSLKTLFWPTPNSNTNTKTNFSGTTHRPVCLRARKGFGWKQQASSERGEGEVKYSYTRQRHGNSALRLPRRT